MELTNVPEPLRIRETERVLQASTQAFSVLFPITFFVLRPFSRWVAILAVVLVPLCLIAEKQFAFLLIRNLHKRGHGLQNVMVYGAGFTGHRVFSALVRSPKLGLNPVAVVDDDKSLAGQAIYAYGYKRERSAPVIAGPLTRNILRSAASAWS